MCECGGEGLGGRGRVRECGGEDLGGRGRVRDGGWCDICLKSRVRESGWCDIYLKNACASGRGCDLGIWAGGSDLEPRCAGGEFVGWDTSQRWERASVGAG